MHSRSKDLVIEDSTSQTPDQSAGKAPDQSTARSAAKPSAAAPKRRKKTLLQRLASIQLAVVIIALLGIVTAWGTIVEAIYSDSTAAQKIVYHSVWMYAVLIMLAINLIAVMIDRYPWKKETFGFVLAHIGLLVLMGGSVATSEFGIDGSLRIPIGNKSSEVTLGNTDFTVYSSFDGVRYMKHFDREVDFFSHPPTREKPLDVPIPSGSIKVIQYFPYSFRDDKIVGTDLVNDGAALRFQLQNAKANFTDWLLQNNQSGEAAKDLGPARVVLTSRPFMNVGNRNTLVLRPLAQAKKLADFAKSGKNGKVIDPPDPNAKVAKDDAADADDAIEYEVYTAREPGKVKKGILHVGDTIETGWMGLVLRVLKFLPHAKQQVTYLKTDAMTPLTTSAMLVDYNGNEQWVGLNSMLKLFSDQAVFVVQYANRRMPLGYDISLKKFEIGHYPGTMQPSSYSSQVEVSSHADRPLENHLISMNEPMKYNGFTFYQSSFDEDEQGRPMASVLSVNFDPGRWIKYLGSLFIVAGIVHLFYMRKKRA